MHGHIQISYYNGYVKKQKKNITVNSKAIATAKKCKCSKALTVGKTAVHIKCDKLFLGLRRHIFSLKFTLTIIAYVVNNDLRRMKRACNAHTGSSAKWVTPAQRYYW